MYTIIGKINRIEIGLLKYFKVNFDAVIYLLHYLCIT